jgi:hypothetical protein
VPVVVGPRVCAVPKSVRVSAQCLLPSVYVRVRVSQWTYQAMVHELMGISDNVVKLTSAKVLHGGCATCWPRGYALQTGL